MSKAKFDETLCSDDEHGDVDKPLKKKARLTQENETGKKSQQYYHDAVPVQSSSEESISSHYCGLPEERNISQNKNTGTGLWCITSQDEDTGPDSSESFWSIGNSRSFDHAVDDPMFWGPYLSERQWGTVREDYSENDNNWEHVSYEDAAHHTYVSGEDGLLGVSDKCALFCTSVAMWNGKDSMLKERLFGLTGIEGNHGEDVKELYYYLDNVPDHSYMRALYKYPHCAFPYQWLREENSNRTFCDHEFELTDTGVFEEGGHWDVVAEYTKTDHLGLACHLEITNCGRHEELLHLIPQFWFRHTQHNEPIPVMTQQGHPQMKAASDGTVRVKYNFGNWRLIFMPDSSREDPVLLFTDNTSASSVEMGGVDLPVFAKDAFHKYVVQGKGDAVNPLCKGTKCGAYYRLTLPAGAKTSVYWRIESLHSPLQMSLEELKNHFVKKRKEALAYYSSVMGTWSKEERNIGIQALAGLLWSKQYYCFDVRNWLRDYRRCQANRGQKGRNSAWSHVHNHHILLMPDKWEFPWYAGWDLCISAVLYSRFCPKFAKLQLTTFLSDDYMSHQGQLPGCEFELGDPNPPLQPWAVLNIFYNDGGTDLGFLRRCFHRLLLNYNWWCSKEYQSTFTYGRGFLGMDNISVIDRSGSLPHGWSLVQADCTGWMACYALWMLKIAVELGQTDLVYCDFIPRFLKHFLSIASHLNKSIEEKGLWHEDDRFLYDVLHTPSGALPICLRSMSGLVPLLACTVIKVRKLSTSAIQIEPYLMDCPQFMCRLSEKEIFLSALCLPRVQSVLERVFSEEEFLGAFGVRSLSMAHGKEPFSMQIQEQTVTVKYSPGESDSGAFGGNSNWRGPVWVFLNLMLLESLDLYKKRASVSNSRTLMPNISPANSLSTLIADLENRLLGIFLPDKQGRRPLHGSVKRYAEDPKWRHLVLFYEYFHADNGRGCGASHQTGWTASIFEIIRRINNRKKQ